MVHIALLLVLTIKSIMDNDSWFTAQEALDAGFVDEITDEMDMAACSEFLSFMEKSKFKNIPDKLRISGQLITKKPKNQTKSEVLKMTTDELKQSYSEIYSKKEVSNALISRYLNWLDEKGLISQKRSGRKKIFNVTKIGKYYQNLKN